MIPGEVVYGAFFGLMFSFLYVFSDELEKIPKGVIRRSFRNFKKAYHNKKEEGIKLTREYFERKGR